MYTITKKIAVLMAMGLMNAQLHAASSELETDAVSPAATGAGEPLEAGAVPATGAGEPDLEHRPRHLRVSVAQLERDPHWNEFLDAGLVYRPHPFDDDGGKTVRRFRDILKEHIEDGDITFPVRVDVFRWLNVARSFAPAQKIRVYIGFKYQKMFGSGENPEFWICPQALAALVRHPFLIPLMPKFTSPVGYFFTIGRDDVDPEKQDYILDQDGDTHGRFYTILGSRENWRKDPRLFYMHNLKRDFMFTGYLGVEFTPAGAQLHAASRLTETDERSAVSPAATGAGEPLEAGAVPSAATGAGEPDLEHRPRHLRVSVADLERDPEWKQFLDAELVYRPNPSNDDGKIVWRFREILAGPISDGAIMNE